MRNAILLLFVLCTANAIAKDKPKWKDPQRGKMAGKVNVVQIPLTAYENHIFGKVKQVKYMDYSVAPDGKKKLEDIGENLYDNAGHLVDQNEFSADGKAKWNCIYKYDEKGRPVSWDLKFGDTVKNLKVTFKCDDQGRKTEQVEVGTSKERSRKFVYKYDSKGNETEVIEYSAGNYIVSVATYKYDSRGFQVEYTRKDARGKLQMKTTQDYDEDGNRTSGVVYASETEVRGKWTATNDSKGRMTETVYQNSDGKQQARSKLKYDDWDNVIEYNEYKPDGTIDATKTTYTEYVYDSKGNPTKETWYIMKDGKKIVTGISEKTYLYY